MLECQNYVDSQFTTKNEVDLTEESHVRNKRTPRYTKVNKILRESLFRNFQRVVKLVKFFGSRSLVLSFGNVINFYGRTPESDNIQIKPVLLQKGRTKLALYGMGNVRDHRLFRTFTEGRVKFFRPSIQKDDWFNLMSVHQNHHKYTQDSEEYLPQKLSTTIHGSCRLGSRTRVPDRTATQSRDELSRHADWVIHSNVSS